MLTLVCSYSRVFPICDRTNLPIDVGAQVVSTSSHKENFLCLIGLVALYRSERLFFCFCTPEKTGNGFMNLQLDVTSPKGWVAFFFRFWILFIKMFMYLSIARLNRLHPSEKEIHFSTLLKGAFIL